jgi:N-formylglutamate deformylase
MAGTATGDPGGAFAGAVRRLFRQMREVCARVERILGSFAVFDLHTYNHYRKGPASPADQAGSPDNLGTGTMPRERWAQLVQRFMAELAEQDVQGAHLDVRENVRFRGGLFPRWVHETFPHTGCALAIEVKKTFMDVYTGELNQARWAAIGQALNATVPGVREELARR